MIQFTFKQLSYFLAAAEHKSTLRAAEALNVSQPAVSMAIRALEDLFQQKLFARKHAQGLALTPFGRRKLAEVRHLLAQASAIASSSDDTRLSGELEVGIFTTLAPAFAPGILRDFKQLHPNVTVRLHEADLEQLGTDLENGVVELAILYDVELGGSIEGVVVAEFRPYVLLPDRHPLARYRAIALSRLAKEPFVLVNLPHSRNYFLSLFHSIGLVPKIAIESPSLEMVRGMVANGHGVGILVTRPSGNRSYDGKKLICREIADAVPLHRVTLAKSSRFPATKLAESFLEVATAYFRRHPGNQFSLTR